MTLLHRNNGLSRGTARVLLVASVLAVVHHADHILRVDHSGWPFRAQVTPFTFSLLAYPILAFTLLGPARLFWWRWLALALGAGFTVYAHSLIETPQMQYAMWAYNRSLEPELWDIRNLCGVRSEGLGWAAVLVGMALNVLLAIATVGMLVDGLRRRSPLASAPR